MKALNIMDVRFGSLCTRLTAFSLALVSELNKVATDYGGVQIEVSPSGLLVKPSLTHIEKRDK